MTDTLGSAAPRIATISGGATLSRGLSGWWLVAVVAAVLYGSLIPFDIDVARFRSASDLRWLDPGLAETPRDDIVTNILAYVPLGAAVALCSRRRRFGHLTSLPLAVVLGAGLSLFAESLQLGSSTRVASMLDVRLNIAGAAAGVVVALSLAAMLPTFAKRWRRLLRIRPFSATASLMTAGLFLYHLAPFDFAWDAATLHTSWERARWGLGIFSRSTFHAPPLAWPIAQLTAAAWFGWLAYVKVVAGSASGWHFKRALFNATAQASLLIVSIEVLELFTRTQGFDVTSIALRMFGAFCGGWAGLQAVKHSIDDGRQSAITRLLSTRLLVILAAFQTFAILLAAGDPTRCTLENIGRLRFHWIPFEGLWTQPIRYAAHDAISTLFGYSMMSIMLVILLCRIKFPKPLGFSAVGVMLVATAAEMFHGITVSGLIDPTDLLLALLATVIAVKIFRVSNITVLGGVAKASVRAGQSPRLSIVRRS